MSNTSELLRTLANLVEERAKAEALLASAERQIAGIAAQLKPTLSGLLDSAAKAPAEPAPAAAKPKLASPRKPARPDARKRHLTVNPGERIEPEPGAVTREGYAKMRGVDSSSVYQAVKRGIIGPPALTPKLCIVPELADLQVIEKMTPDCKLARAAKAALETATAPTPQPEGAAPTPPAPKPAPAMSTFEATRWLNEAYYNVTPLADGTYKVGTQIMSEEAMIAKAAGIKERRQRLPSALTGEAA